MATVTGFTAARSKEIEDGTVVDGDVVGDNLILLRRDGQQINAGNVRGPQGIQGVPGSITVSPAGGDLSGSYPNPTIATAAIDDTKAKSVIKDGLATRPSLRTLGTGAQQAAAGNHQHGDTGWINVVPTLAGDAPFAVKAVVYLQYKRFGPLCHVRMRKDSSAAADRTANVSGNFTNTNILPPGTLPLAACPVDYSPSGTGRFNDSPAGIVITPTGSVVWIGGFPRNYPAGSSMIADFVFMTTNAA